MKKVLASALVIMAMMLWAVPQVWADDLLDEMAEELRLQHHGAWASGLIPDTGGPRPYMVTSDVDRQTNLIIEYYSGGEHHISILVNLNRFKFPNVTALSGKTVSGIIDGGRVAVDVHFRVKVDKSLDCMSLELEDPYEGAQLIVDCGVFATPSSVLRIKVEGMKNFWQYPLNGFGDGVRRCNNYLK